MTLSPARGILIVKPIETTETLPGCLIALTENARKDWAQWQMEVVGVGEPEWCQAPKKKCQRRDAIHIRLSEPGDTSLFGSPSSPSVHARDKRLTPGAWVIVQPRQIVPLSSEGNLFAVRHEHVVGVFMETEEAYAP